MFSLMAGVLLQAAVGSLSLEQAIDHALEHRGSIVAAGAATREAWGLHRMAGQIPNPSLRYSRTEDTPRQHVSLEQPFDWLLTRGADRAVSGAGIRRAELDSVGRVSATLQEVRRAFFGALAATEVHRLVTDLRDTADSLRRLAQLRFEAGDISRFELEQIEQDARRQGLTLSEAREGRDQAMAALGQAIGWVGPPPPPEGSLDAGLDDSLDLAPEAPLAVRLAEADSAIAVAAAGAARRARVPFPSLEIGAEWDDPSGTRGTALSVVGITVPFPVWHRSGGEVAVAAARAARADAVLTDARLESARQVADTRGQMREAGLRARFARDSLLPAARTLRERAVTAYQAGETGVVPVLEALRSEREVSLGLIQDLIRYQDARATWLELFGRRN